MDKSWQDMLHSGKRGVENPFLLKGMKEAIRRVVQAINEREKIVIYGSCDVDGIAGTSLLFLIFKYLNADVEYYIPDDLKNNYELSKDVIHNHIKFLGATLVITVGCGIHSIKEVQICHKLNIDVIITDYHWNNKELPETIVINPKQVDCEYPFKELKGAAIAYKLAEALSMYYNMKCIKRYIDLVMIGTLSQNVVLRGENKRIVEEGLAHLYHTNNYGVKALLKIHTISKMNIVTVRRLIETTTPTVNAVGSMDNARIAVELFTTSDKERAEQIAKYLDRRYVNKKSKHEEKAEEKNVVKT